MIYRICHRNTPDSQGKSRWKQSEKLSFARK
nr:MAG TPA: hypothetical protein [Bacteriophage sp.]